MQKLALMIVPALALTACGSDPVPGPTEQIIVREPGEVAISKAPADQITNGKLAAGKEVFAACAACHNIEKDAPDMAGPNLYGIVGQKAGAVEGFGYSEALKSANIVWTDEELDAYLANPMEKVPGTTMVAGAIADSTKRTAVIAYIRTISENPTDD